MLLANQKHMCMYIQVSGLHTEGGGAHWDSPPEKILYAILSIYASSVETLSCIYRHIAFIDCRENEDMLSSEVKML